MKPPFREIDSFYAELKAIYIENRDAFVFAALKIVGERQLAEDAVHDAYASLIKDIDQFRQVAVDKQAPYVLACVLNAARDIYKSRHKGIIIPLFDDDDPGLPAEGQTPETLAVSSEGLREIKAALADLDELSYDILVASSWRGESDEDIAARHNLSEGAVRVRRHRIRQRLKNMLAKEGNERGKD